MAVTSRRLILLALPLVIMLAAVVAAIGRTGTSTGFEPTAGTAVDPPRPIAAFELTDQAGARFTRRHLKGQWSLLFAGFTHCPDICPVTLARLNALDDNLRAAGGELQTVFLSLDPERDTPERLAEYMGYFNPDFVGVTGEQAEIDKLTGALGLAYVKVPGSRGSYTVDHSTAVVLIDPEGRAAAYFRAPLDIEALTADLTPLATRPR
jgi:protein SCO1